MEVPLSAAGRQILTFALANRLFAFDVLTIREVLFLEELTPLPDSADWMAGVINLRGRMVPVLDLRRRFRMPPADRSADTAVIIVEVPAAEGEHELGVLVDQVRGVAHCPAGAAGAPPQFGGRISGPVVQSVARLDAGFVVVLDASRLLDEASFPDLSAETAPQEN